MSFFSKLFPKRINIWTPIESMGQLQDAYNASLEKPSLIILFSNLNFSGEYVISDTEKKAMEIDRSKMNFYLLNALGNSSLVNKLEADFNLADDNPQILIVRNNKLIFHKAHDTINLVSLYQQMKDKNIL